MFAYLKNNKKGSKDIVIAQMIGDEEKIYQQLPNDSNPNHRINSFVDQAMSYYYNQDGLLFNNFADCELLFGEKLLNDLYCIRGWLNYPNETTAKLRINKINSDFAKFYYDVLPLVKFQEVERIPMLKLPMVVNSLDASNERKQEVYRNILISAMNNEQLLSVLDNHIKIEKKKSVKVKVK